MSELTKFSCGKCPGMWTTHDGVRGECPFCYPPKKDFASHPKSITEHKAHKSESLTDWTPRDVLIDMLRAHRQRRVRDRLFGCVLPRD